MEEKSRRMGCNSDEAMDLYPLSNNLTRTHSTYIVGLGHARVIESFGTELPLVASEFVVLALE
jgi:hypothetical protein